MKLHSSFRSLVLLSGLAFAAVTQAYTIHVTTAEDEDVGAGGTGCSLREALQLRFNNMSGTPYNGCSTGAFSPGDPATIVFDGNYTISVNSNSAGDATRHGSLSIPGTSLGALTIDGSGQTVTINCPASPNNSKIFIEASGASLTLSNLTIGGASGCTASGAGIAVDNSTDGNLTINTVTFSNIHSDSGGNGGAIAHGTGTLSITDSNFTSNGSDGGLDSGNGGAIFIDSVTTASITNTTFTSNTAGNNGGAIYYSNNAIPPYALTLTNVTFTSNTANGGDTADDGGGAIWAQTESPTDVTGIFLISNGAFINNTAPNGNGGAIVLAFDSRLAYASAALPNAGGIYGSNFAGNSASGAVTPNGAGGAIYSRGVMTVVQSSFISNSSTSDFGGAIATNYATTPSVIANTTFNGNSAPLGGGAIANLNTAGTLQIINATVAGNTSAGSGGSLFNANSAAGAVTVNNSIFGATSPGTNCGGNQPDTGTNNLEYSFTGGACAFTVGDPLLSSPTINAPASGAPVTPLVLTMAIGESSPASHGGNPATCSAGPINSTDATGAIGVRPFPLATNCDIGAYESGSTTPVQLQSFSVD